MHGLQDTSAQNWLNVSDGSRVAGGSEFLLVGPETAKQVASLGGADRPGWHPPGGDTRMEKMLWPNLQRIVDKRGRSGKKVRVTPCRGEGEIRVKSIKVIVISKKGRQFF